METKRGTETEKERKDHDEITNPLHRIQFLPFYLVKSGRAEKRPTIRLIPL